MSVLHLSPNISFTFFKRANEPFFVVREFDRKVLREGMDGDVSPSESSKKRKSSTPGDLSKKKSRTGSGASSNSEQSHRVRLCHGLHVQSL